jgi:hypothetical protein
MHISFSAPLIRAIQDIQQRKNSLDPPLDALHVRRVNPVLIEFVWSNIGKMELKVRLEKLHGILSC